MQSAVQALVSLGPLPASDLAEVASVEQYARLLKQVRMPVSDAEAEALCGLFGPDDCFGLAWSLLHLVETAPGWPLASALGLVARPWQDRLRLRT